MSGGHTQPVTGDVPRLRSAFRFAGGVGWHCHGGLALAVGWCTASKRGLDVDGSPRSDGRDVG